MFATKAMIAAGAEVLVGECLAEGAAARGLALKVWDAMAEATVGRNAEHRATQLGVRMSLELRQEIEATAEKVGLPTSDFMRRALAYMVEHVELLTEGT